MPTVACSHPHPRARTPAPALALDSTKAVLIKDAFLTLHLKQIPALFCVSVLLLYTGTAAAAATLLAPLLSVLCEKQFGFVCCILCSAVSYAVPGPAGS